MAATGNKNNWKGGVAKWPEIRVRVPPEVHEALGDVNWYTANQQVLRILKEWDEDRIAKESVIAVEHRSGIPER